MPNILHNYCNEYFNTFFNFLHIFTLLLLYIIVQSFLSCTSNLIMMTWSHQNIVLFLYRSYLFSSVTTLVGLFKFRVNVPSWNYCTGLGVLYQLMQVKYSIGQKGANYVADVHVSCVFYGPVYLIGNSPIKIMQLRKCSVISRGTDFL